MKRMKRAFVSGGVLNILGVSVHPVSMTEAVTRVLTWAGTPAGRPRLVFATGVHGIMEARRHPGGRAWSSPPGSMESWKRGATLPSRPSSKKPI